MRTHTTLLGLTAIAGLLLGAGLALADDAAPEASPPPKPGREFCKENPGKCEDARARHEAFCKENPEKCKEREQKRAERRAFCKENPETCKEQRAQRKQRRAEMKARCEADPEKCKEMKRQMRERHQQQRGSDSKPAE